MIVDLLPTDEQQLIVQSIDALLECALPMTRLKEVAAWGGAAERRAWRQLAELGLFGFGLGEAAGGAGYGLAEEVLAARSLGRYCVSPTVLATMLAARLASEIQRPEVRDAFLSGSARAAFANPLGNGQIHLVDAAASEWLLLLGRPPALVARSAVSQASAVAGIDETVTLERAPMPACATIEVELAEHASLLLAAYLVGNAQATLAMAVAYARVREQFGQPIGAFQAIKHSCADMAVRAAAAEAQTFFAALSASAGSARVETACARLLAREAAVANARANVQIHGGMGFTAECDVHVYLKRALLASLLGSDPRTEQRLIIPTGAPDHSGELREETR